MPLSTGTTVGCYEILSSLGEGGMGEVYLAKDTRLARSVALKILRHDADASDRGRRRFGQEAQTASSLNHPNIIAIFDVGQQDGLDFIAMEFVEGQTLRAMASNGPIDIKRALDLIAQAAAGLAAAHDAHVVHRDIKPENLIVGRNGHLKILDFGLAKLSEKQRAMLASQATTATGTPALTEVGTIAGTTAYMSPEQAQGAPLDGRSDIFSLGVVLYELLTGRKAFSGKSVIDVLHAIIHTELRPATEVNPRLPAEVTEILGKALAKDPSERYRHAGDLELDLRRLKRGLENATLPSQAASRRSDTLAARAMRWLPAVAAIGLAVAAGNVWLMSQSTQGKATGGVEGVTLTPLTTDAGFEGDPSFAPDGETLAYVSDRTGNFEIFLRQVSGGADVNVSNDAADDVQPSFSPDGRQIAFVSTRSGASDLLYVGPNIPPKGGDVWIMPALGGNPRRVARSGNFPSWSPDGSELLFTSGPWFGPKLYRVSASGGEPREIALQFGGAVQPAHLLYPRFSPDQRWIVLSSSTEVYAVSASGGPVTTLARGQAPAWGAGARSIIYSSAEAGTNQSLWSVPFDTATGRASGPAQPLTVGRGADLQAASSRDGKRVAFAATDVSTRIEVQGIDAETGRLRGSPSVLTDSRDQFYFFDLSADGRSALFAQRRGPTTAILHAGEDRAPVLLASDAKYDYASPLWSPDGRTIAFSRRSTEDLEAGFSLWTMASDGANPQQAAKGLGLNGIFAWMPDGRSMVRAGTDRQLSLVDLASSTERALTREPGVMPVVAVSRDGEWVVYQCVVGGSVDLHAVSTAGGPARVVVAGPAEDYHPWLSPSGRWVYYLPDHKNLYRVPGPSQNWRAAAPEKITDFHLTPLSIVENPQLSRDGQSIAYVRGHITSDIWLMTMSR